jgi:hypothetical protein
MEFDMTEKVYLRDSYLNCTFICKEEYMMSENIQCAGYNVGNVCVEITTVHYYILLYP